MDTASVKQDLIAAEAAEWFVRLRDLESDREARARFAAWLRHSPEHVAEYLSIADVWSDSRAALDSYGSIDELLAEARDDHGNVVTISAPPRHPRESGGPGQRIDSRPRSESGACLRGNDGMDYGKTRRSGFPFRLATAAALVITALGALLWFAGPKNSARDYQTGPGEKLTISLEDGSVVHLNTDSDVRIDLNRALRAVDLRRGEARFHVAKDPHRPFVVATDRATVKVLGTVFNVYRRAADTKVTVVEGKVDVQGTAVSAGEEVAVFPAGKVERQPAADIGHVMSWPQHRLTFRSRPLAEVIEELNRYNAPSMRIDDAQLAKIEISGAFEADDPRSLLAYLQRHEGVEISRAWNGTVILRRRDEK